MKKIDLILRTVANLLEKFLLPDKLRPIRRFVRSSFYRIGIVSLIGLPVWLYFMHQEVKESTDSFQTIRHDLSERYKQSLQRKLAQKREQQRNPENPSKKE